MPLSLFHPYERLPPEGSVSGARGFLRDARPPHVHAAPPLKQQLASLNPHPPPLMMQTLMREEETCDPEERLCRVSPPLPQPPSQWQHEVHAADRRMAAAWAPLPLLAWQPSAWQLPRMAAACSGVHMPPTTLTFAAGCEPQFALSIPTAL